jgi:hypothetical protein
MYLALGRQRQEDQEFEVNLGYIARSCLKEKKKSQLIEYATARTMMCHCRFINPNK